MIIKVTYGKRPKFLYHATMLLLLGLLVFTTFGGNVLYNQKNWIAYYNPVAQTATVQLGDEDSLQTTLFDVTHEYGHHVWNEDLNSRDRHDWQKIIDSVGYVSTYCYECNNYAANTSNRAFYGEEFAECYAENYWNGGGCGELVDNYMLRWME